MAQLLIRDLDETVLAKLEARAARHRSSVEVEACRALAESVAQDFATVIQRFDAFVADLPPDPGPSGEALLQAARTRGVR